MQINAGANYLTVLQEIGPSWTLPQAAQWLYDAGVNLRVAYRIYRAWGDTFLAWSCRG